MESLSALIRPLRSRAVTARWAAASSLRTIITLLRVLALPTARTPVGPSGPDSVFSTRSTAAIPISSSGRNLAGRRADLTDSNFPDLNFTLPYHNLGTAVPLLTTPFVLAETYTTRVPYVMQYLFNVQRQVSAKVALEVGYIGNQGRKLQRIGL